MRKTSQIYDYLRKLANNRIIILLVLVLILSGLCVYYDHEYQDHLNHLYTSTHHLKDPVTVSGAVTSFYPGGFVITDIYTSGRPTYRIESPVNVSLGDKVQVMGIIHPPNILTNNKIMVSRDWADTFVIVRSVIGLLILLVVFFKYWRFNFKEMIFVWRKK